MDRFNIWWFVLCTVVTLSGCQGIYKDPNTTLLTLKHGGLEREAVLHLPSGYDESAAYPLVLLLHGGKGSAERMAKRLGWIEKADENGFIVVFPQGENKHWNDGRGTTESSEENIDDLGFISGLIDHIMENYAANDQKVFVTGVSNGGFMTYKIGCELSAKITAIAPVIATLPENQECQPEEPSPILFILGTEDVFVPYEGGEMERGAGGMILSAEETFATWEQINGCSGDIKTEVLPDNYDDGTTVSVLTATDCDSNLVVIQYKVEGGGHEWQGHRSPGATLGDGHRTEEISATNVIWDFFSQF